MRALGLDVGGTNVKFAIYDGHEVRGIRQTKSAGGIQGALDAIRSCRDDLDAVGLGLAGLVRWPSGRFVWGPHLWETGLELREALVSELGVPVAVDNDANMAAIAELRLGAARGADSALILTLGTGIGAAIVVGGQVYRGRSFAGELGHIRAMDNGEACACGMTGCWETLVSGSVLDTAARRLTAESPDGLVAVEASGAVAAAVHLVAAADRGDPEARQVLELAGGHLGRLIAAQVAALDPEIVVVGGAVAAAGEMFFDAARASISTNLIGAAYRDPVDIRISPFHAFGGAIGAAVAGFEAVDV